MLNKILESGLYSILTKHIGLQNINEIRLRNNKPIVIIKSGQAFFINENGLSLNIANSIYCTQKQIEDIIFKASEFSIYSINEELKQGYIVLDDGERIGICGTVVQENGRIKTITNFTSLNIRIPHEVKGCSLKILPYIFQNNSIKNTLIISSPGQGKTTLLRDIVSELSQKNYMENVLIVDERGEIAGKGGGELLGLGNFCDVLSFSNKKNGFLQGIRSMSPKIIVTDELGDDEDFDAIKYASNCGIKIIASIHAENIYQVKNKSNFSKISNIFDKYVVLKSNTKPGEIDGVYDASFQKIL